MHFHRPHTKSKKSLCSQGIGVHRFPLSRNPSKAHTPIADTTSRADTIPPPKQTTTATDSVHYIGIIFLLLTCPSYCLLSLEEINKLYNVRSYHVHCSIDESMYYKLHTGLEVSQGSGQCWGNLNLQRACRIQQVCDGKVGPKSKSKK